MIASPAGLNVRHFSAGRSIRSMCGHTGARLVEVGSGHAYVTKLQFNLFGPRVLAAEWIGGHLMQHLGLPTPPMALIKASPTTKDTTEGGRCSLAAGTHFGSEYPGDPSSIGVYDFLPDRLMVAVENGHAFAGAFVFDVWVGNADARQAIFHRNRSGRRQLSALFVDNSHIFGGPEWGFAEHPMTGRYASRVAYDGIRNWNDLSPWLKDIEQTVDRQIIREVMSSVPDEWLRHIPRRDMERVAERLASRSQVLKDLVAACIRSSPGSFPKWLEERPRG